MSLISLITLVRNFTFTSMDHTVSHFISLFFSSIFFKSIRLVLRIKNQVRGSICYIVCFSLVELPLGVRSMPDPTQMKTINSTVSKSEVRFQNDNKFSRLKISGYSIGYKISTKSDFEWRSIVNRIE